MVALLISVVTGGQWHGSPSQDCQPTQISRDFLRLICYLKSLFHFDFRLAFNTSGDFSLFNLLFTVASNQSNFQLKIPVKVTAVALSVMRVGEMSCPEIHTFYPALCPEPHNIQQCSCVASRLSGSHHDGQSCLYAGDKTRQQEMAWLVTAEKIKSGQQKPVLNWTWTHQARQCIATARKIFLSYFFCVDIFCLFLRVKNACSLDVLGAPWSRGLL